MAPPPMPAVGASGAEIEDSAPPPILMALLSAFATISTLLYFLASMYVYTPGSYLPSPASP